MSMGINGVTQAANGTQYEAPTVKSSEDKLSKKAQDYLADLRSKYGDYDFIIANDSDDKKALVKQSTKSVSAVFSTAEMERMEKNEKYAAEKLRNVDTAVRNGNKIAEDYGAVYEKGFNQNSGLYSINKKSQADRTALVDQLKADMESRKSQLIDLVHKTLSGQIDSFGKASDENSIWRTLASGKFTVDAATKAQAQKDISEDGYWGVKQTSQRLFDFASALAGDDVDKMKEMQAAMEKGYKQATKTWGRELPSISKETIDAANKLFEDYYNSKKTEVITE